MDSRLYCLHRTLSESLTPYVAEMFHKDYLKGLNKVSHPGNSHQFYTFVA